MNKRQDRKQYKQKETVAFSSCPNSEPRITLINISQWLSSHQTTRNPLNPQ